MRADQLNELIGEGSLRNTIGVGLQVAHIADMADLIVRSTVGLLERVEVRASRSAAIGVVAELVNVESALCVGVVALDLVLNGGRGVLGFLGELDNTADTGVTTENSN